MTQYILWSGGCDSTRLLQQEAQSNPNDIINAVTIKEITPTKQGKMEEKARSKLKKILPKNIRYHSVTVKQTLIGNTWQMPYWLCYLTPNLSNGDVVKMAYLSSDGSDFWDKKNDLINAFNSIMKLMGKDAKLEFPYQYSSKGDVIAGCIAGKILKYVWWCGEPKNNKPCGKCMKCISVKRWKKYPQKGTLT